MQIYIKYLPKDKLLYRLWEAARFSPNLYYCQEHRPILTYDIAKNDINFMIHNKRPIDLTTYYGRLLYIDITDDYTDVFNYDLYNGKGTAKKIIDSIKEEEMNNTVCRYYLFF